MLQVLLIVAAVVVCLFVLSFAVYFFNLDMKLAAAMIPVMNKIYDRGKAKREKKAAQNAVKAEAGETSRKNEQGVRGR